METRVPYGIAARIEIRHKRDPRPGSKLILRLHRARPPRHGDVVEVVNLATGHATLATVTHIEAIDYTMTVELCEETVTVTEGDNP